MVNETLGHAAGDQLLVQVGERLVTAARSTDTVARLGSDEFGILLGPVRSVREAERVASRIEAAIAVPFDLDGTEVTVGASMGIAVGSATLPHPFDLLKQAEIALHRAKADPVRHDGAVRPRDARPDPRPGDPRERPAARDRALRAAAPLPAAGRPRHGRRDGHGGAAALAAPDAWHRAAALVHPAGRGDRPHPADRPLGAGDRVPPAARLAAADPGRGAPGRERQPVGPPVRRVRADRRTSPRSSTTPAWIPPASSWRSPRAS